jgi:hypothetical protein
MEAGAGVENGGGRLPAFSMAGGSDAGWCWW